MEWRVVHESLMKSYYWQHLTAWVVMSIVFSVLFYGVCAGCVAYVDSLFLVVSTVTATGLSTVDLSAMPAAGRLFVLGLVPVGGAVFESLIPLVKRLWRARGQPACSAEVEQERTAIRYLLVVVVCYAAAVHAAGVAIFGCYLRLSQAGSDAAAAAGVDGWWLSVFQTATAFQNAGFSLLPDNYVPFAAQALPLLLTSALVVLGNSGYPVALRLVVLGLYRLCALAGWQRPAAVYRYILRQPRRCLTHLFPAAQTQILAAVVVASLVLHTLATAALEWHGAAFADVPDAQLKLVNAFFLAVSCRTAGFNAVATPALRTATLVLVAGAMYLAAYPFTVLMRTSNERQRKPSTFKLQKTVSRDFLCLFLAWFLIAAIEGTHTAQPDFAIFFEVVTAFGTVGLSLGARGGGGGGSAALSSTWSPLSKLVLIAVMIVGRHRGMPADSEAAIRDEHTDADVGKSQSAGI